MDTLEKSERWTRSPGDLVHVLIACYFIAYLDRVNVGFANTSSGKDLSLSAAAFGEVAQREFFSSPIFFFEVPSGLALNRFGARLWIARIMFTWGIISGGTSLYRGRRDERCVVRLLLGLAEAGFSPASYFT